jgi:type IV secretory pathway VirB10-like protein
MEQSVPRNDDGEFELVLGNRQLLSVFFIVVVLLGVFFTMGYIVGRNSAPVIADAQRRADKPVSVDSGIVTETAPPPVSDVPPPRETAQQLPSDVPAADARSDKADATPEPPPAKTAEKSAKKKETKGADSAKADAAKKSKAASNDQPASGQSYLQLAATTKREADVMVDVLRQKGFKALAAEIQEKPGIFRVLVGPVAEGGRNALRADLQKSGFPGNAAIPRTF